MLLSTEVVWYVRRVRVSPARGKGKGAMYASLSLSLYALCCAATLLRT